MNAEERGSEGTCEWVRSKRSLHSRLFAAFQKWGSAKYAPHVHERKQRLFRDLSGDVLEIGAGTGVNFDYFPKGLRWVGLDPNPHMHRHLRTRAESLGMNELDLRLGVSESIPLPDASVDHVVATLVLCSVHDLERSVSEILRVLRPGGTFRFLEHVAAPSGTSLRKRQRFFRRPWMFVGDGCQPDRETLDAVENAGFSSVDAEAFSLPFPLVSPHVMGIARK